MDDAGGMDACIEPYDITSMFRVFESGNLGFFHVSTKELCGV